MKTRNKKGISQIIVVMMMIIMVLGATAIVFNVINNLVGEQIESSEACFGNFGKITINKQYTCYNSSSNEIQFLINVGDVNIDGVLVSVSGSSGSKSFRITDNIIISFVRAYNGLYGQVISPPQENSGVTYLVNLSEVNIFDADLVEIAPIMKNIQCEVSDSLSGIGDCRLLT